MVTVNFTDTAPSTRINGILPSLASSMVGLRMGNSTAFLPLTQITMPSTTRIDGILPAQPIDLTGMRVGVMFKPQLWDMSNRIIVGQIYPRGAR